MMYHRDVYLPKALENEVLSMLVRMDGRVRLTRHAAERATEKGVKIPEKVPFQRAVVVEVSKVLNQVDKFLVRFPQDDQFDVCMSIGRDGRVPTVFLNRRGDKHSTLNREKYEQR